VAEEAPEDLTAVEAEVLPQTAEEKVRSPECPLSKPLDDTMVVEAAPLFICRPGTAICSWRATIRKVLSCASFTEQVLAVHYHADIPPQLAHAAMRLLHRCSRSCWNPLRTGRRV